MPKTVLVAEDNVMVRNILVITLLRENYNVLEADTGAEALELSRSFDGTIDLLVADQFLRTMRVGELFHQLRLSRPGLRVLQLSGRPLSLLISDQDLIPGADFLQKP